MPVLSIRRAEENLAPCRANNFPSNYDPNVWPELNVRDGIRNRYNVARLIGGATTGPGNIGLLSSYSSPRSGQVLYVNLVRTNGTLGPLSANFSVQPELAQSGAAQSGADYIDNADAPLYWETWEYVSHKSRITATACLVPTASCRMYTATLGRAGLPNCPRSFSICHPTPPWPAT